MMAHDVPGSMGFVKEKRLHKYYLNGNDVAWTYVFIQAFLIGHHTSHDSTIQFIQCHE